MYPLANSESRSGCYLFVRAIVFGLSVCTPARPLLLWSLLLSFKFEYGFCPTSDNQDDQQYGCHLPGVWCRGHCNLVIFNRFLPNFIYRLLSSNSSPSSNTDFVGRTITEMANKMATAYQCLLLWSLLLSHF